MMRFKMIPLIILLFILSVTVATPTIGRPCAVELSYGKFIGSSQSGIDTFNGIPYAQPPLKQLRLKPPKAIATNLGIINLPARARSCPQFASTTNSTHLSQNTTNSGEDCLTVNVQRPSTASKDSRLPVVFYIFGGAFEVGSSSELDASGLINASMTQNKDILYVAVNYRVGGFGFLGGKEILKDGAANLGLLDQRLALEWVADNIAEFGGDPDKVTIWGESAGSISVFDQMALFGGNYTYKGYNLFRGAIMDSGSITPTEPIDGYKGQQVYDMVVKAAGCSAESDTLECLRSLDYQVFFDAANSVPSAFGYDSIALSYLPRPDGKVLPDSPDQLAKTGQFAPVPFIIGDQEDEGTAFALTQKNLTTTEDLIDYFNTIYFPQLPRSTVSELVNLYPDDPSAGSPFRTGPSGEIYPQFKRLAAILGDVAFTLTRRVFLQYASEVYPCTPTWSYLSSYLHGTPILGTYHGSDLGEVYGTTPGFPSVATQDYYISFIYRSDPNGGAGRGKEASREWPMWSDGHELLNFQATENLIVADNFRAAAAAVIANGTFRF